MKSQKDNTREVRQLQIVLGIVTLIALVFVGTYICRFRSLNAKVLAFSDVIQQVKTDTDAKIAVAVFFKQTASNTGALTSQAFSALRYGGECISFYQDTATCWKNASQIQNLEIVQGIGGIPALGDPSINDYCAMFPNLLDMCRITNSSTSSSSDLTPAPCYYTDEGCGGEDEGTNNNQDTSDTPYCGGSDSGDMPDSCWPDNYSSGNWIYPSNIEDFMPQASNTNNNVQPPQNMTEECYVYGNCSTSNQNQSANNNTPTTASHDTSAQNLWFNPIAPQENSHSNSQTQTTTNQSSGNSGGFWNTFSNSISSIFSGLFNNNSPTIVTPPIVVPATPNSTTTTPSGSTTVPSNVPVSVSSTDSSCKVWVFRHGTWFCTNH